MPYTETAVPAAGTPTRRSLIKAIIENIAYLFSSITGLIGSGTAPNGSFEIDSNADTVPDEWTYTAGAGAGTGVIDSTDSSHGGKCFKFTRNAGVGNSGGTLETTDYFEVASNAKLYIRWAQKCSAAGMRVKVEIRYFTRAKVFTSATDVYNSTSNPTSWTVLGGIVTVPSSNAFFAKIKITGGDTSPNVAGTTSIDELSVSTVTARVPQQQVFTSTGSFTPTTPTIKVRVWAGGGGGGAGDTHGGGGGGGGGYAEGIITVTPGTALTVTVGQGGAGGSGVNGSPGGDSSVSTVSANGGGGGVEGTGAAGSGGTGGTGTGSLNVTGQVGDAGSGANGGQGGFGALGGAGGRANAASAGRTCGGGGGGGPAGGAGSSGGDGRVIIEY